MAIIIDGKEVSAKLRADLAKEIIALAARKVVPGLAAILVGDNPASNSYVNAKVKACAQIGIFSEVTRLPADTAQLTLIQHIRALNQRDDIHGILVQSPLPNSIDERAVQREILPSKDIDCFHPESVGLLSLGEPRFLPCTPAGVLELLRHYEIRTSGARVAVIGRSNIVGRPLATMLSQKGCDATVTLCHSATRETQKICAESDIVIVVIGKPQSIGADHIRSGAVVIDVGINRIPDTASASGYRLVGDVDYSAVEPKASHITPVPGGVGPMTIAMLLQNTVRAAELSRT